MCVIVKGIPLLQRYLQTKEILVKIIWKRKKQALVSMHT
jgi:hypothetical protein